MLRPISSHSSRAFSLVELTVVVVILGVIAMFAIPRYQQSVEEAKARAVFRWCRGFQAVQERVKNWDGSYSMDPDDLDTEVELPQWFDWTNKHADSDGWEVTFTRQSPAPNWGQYTIVWNQKGWNEKKSTIPKELRPVSY